jgi:hypothetical protein
LLPIVTLVKCMQSWNAVDPKLVTLSGIVYLPALPPGYWMS